jgi:hypothetical protein
MPAAFALHDSERSGATTKPQSRIIMKKKEEEEKKERKKKTPKKTNKNKSF